MKRFGDTEPPPHSVLQEQGDSEGRDDSEAAVPLLLTRHGRSKTHTVVPEVSQILNAVGVVEEDLEEAWSSSKERTPLGWFVLLAILILCVGGWGIYKVFQARLVDAPVISAQHTLKLERQAVETRKIKDPLPKLQECVRGFYESEGSARMHEFVRHPDRVEPLIRDYYARHDIRKLEFSQFEHLRAVSIEGKSFVYATVALKPEGHRSLLLEQSEDGSFRIDWESSVMYQPIPWDDYVEKRPLAPMEMRVQIEPDHFYAHAFGDESRYQCYRLSAIGSNEYLFGYVEKGSKVADQIAEIIEKLTERQELASPAPSPTVEESLEIALPDFSDELVPYPVIHLIVKLRFVEEDASKRGVKIDALLSGSLIYVNSPEG